MWLRSHWISGRQSSGLGGLCAPFPVSGPHMEYCLEICPQGITEIPLDCSSPYLTKLHHFTCHILCVCVCTPHKYHIYHTLCIYILHTRYTYHNTPDILDITHATLDILYTQIQDISPTYTQTTHYTRHHTLDISHCTCTSHTSHTTFALKDLLKAWNIRLFP